MSKPALLLLAAALVLTGCEGKKTEAEKNAEFIKGERVKKKAQAAKFYSQLAEKFPTSPFASQARERLQALGPVATPAGGARPGAPAPRK